MKIDTKSILILFLLVCSLIFGYMWYFKSNNTEYKKQLRELRDENQKLQKGRDSIDLKLKRLENDFIVLKSEESVLIDKIKNLEIEIDENKLRANKSKSELDKLRRELNSIRNKIKDMKDNPIDLTGDDLLRSLKNNSKR
jgi:chromosome segregation ATPase